MRQHRKPCKACPFRRESVRGWLGAAPPEAFVAALLITEEPLPCHNKIDYTDPDWLRDFETAPQGRRCAGALVMAANRCKLARDPTVPRFPADHTVVFSTPREFVDHHRNGGFQSWNDNDVEALALLRLHLGLPPLDIVPEPV